MTTGKTIYLDYATMTPLSPYVWEKMVPFFKRYWQAENAPYLTGKEPFASLNHSRDQVLSLLGADKNASVAFTSSSAAGLEYLMHQIYLTRCIEEGKTHLIVLDTEELATKKIFSEWEKAGCTVHRIPLSTSPHVTKEALERVLSPRTALVSLSWAHPLTGVVQPICELAELCRQKGVWIHVDATTIVGKLYFPTKDLPIDFLTIDGDRMYGPRGSGALVTQIDPPFPVSSTALLNPALTIGLGVACEEMQERFDQMVTETARLKTLFEKEVEKECDATILFEAQERVPNVTCLSFKGVSSELLSFHLQERNIYANMGTCRYPSLSQLLHNMGQDKKVAQAAMSFSFSHLTTKEEVKEAVGTLADSVRVCRNISRGIKEMG